MDDLVDADSVLRGFGFRDLDSESQNHLWLGTDSSDLWGSGFRGPNSIDLGSFGPQFDLIQPESAILDL